MAILDIGRVAPDQPGRRWVSRAEQLLAHGDPEAALAACDEGLLAHPDDAGCLLMRARVLHRLQRLEEAMQALWKVVALDPSRPEARRGLQELLAGPPISPPVPPQANAPAAASSFVDATPAGTFAEATPDSGSWTLWTDDMFGDLEERLRAREGGVALPASDQAALAELERWLSHLTGDRA